jgi:hypothetical protein
MCYDGVAWRGVAMRRFEVVQLTPLGALDMHVREAIAPLVLALTPAAGGLLNATAAMAEAAGPAPRVTVYLVLLSLAFRVLFHVLVHTKATQLAATHVKSA